MTSWRRIAFNLFTFVPGTSGLPLVRNTLEKRSIGTGGSVSPRYCYSVWLRHLVRSAQAGFETNPATVAELGPGDSLGAGIAALLTGASRYYALDVVAHANAERNLSVYRDILRLLQSRAAIPDNTEFPEIRPLMDDYSFPSHILSEKRLAEGMQPDRLRRIEQSIRDPGEVDSLIQYKAPWDAAHVTKENSVDMIFSQAVLEHVDDLPSTYAVMRKWLRPNGHMSHVIDFRSHGWTNQWNGHWACSDLAWKIIRGKDVWSINRAPFSEHMRLLTAGGFVVTSSQVESTPTQIGRHQVARRFRSMTDADIITSGVLLLAH